MIESLVTDELSAYRSTALNRRQWRLLPRDAPRAVRRTRRGEIFCHLDRPMAFDGPIRPVVKCASLHYLKPFPAQGRRLVRARLQLQITHQPHTALAMQGLVYLLHRAEYLAELPLDIRARGLRLDDESVFIQERLHAGDLLADRDTRADGDDL